MGEGGEPARPERGRVRARGGAPRSVEGGLGGGGLIPHEPERVAAEAAGLAHHHRQDGVRRDRGIDSAPARPEDAEAGRGREVMRRHHRGGAAPRKRGRRERAHGIHLRAF